MSDLARELIRINKATRAPSINLGNCAMAAIPREIGDCQWLKSVVLAEHWWEWDRTDWIERVTQNTGRPNFQNLDLRPLAPLTGLASLALGDTTSDLTPLAGMNELEALNINGTLVSHLRSVQHLTNLRSLAVWSSGVEDLASLSRLFKLEAMAFVASGSLDLSPLANLDHLVSLSLPYLKTGDLSPLGGLENLRALFLPYSHAYDLSPVALLKNLQKLDISHTPVSDLSPLRSSLALEWLACGHSNVSDLSPLSSLPKLEWLHARSSGVSDLTPLRSIRSLHGLYVADTQVANLEPLAGLQKLQAVDVRRTHVHDLAPLRHLIERSRVDGRSRASIGGSGVFVEGCSLTNPPIEVANQGSAAILNYFKERESSGVDRLYEAKMLIVGEGGAGKTSLLRRLYKPELPLPSEGETTKGIAIHRHEFLLRDGQTFRLNVWDFGGQEIYHATHQFFLTQRSLYVILDDTRKDNKSVGDEGFKYWLELIDVFGGRSPTLIFQNEKGGRSKAIDVAGIKGAYENVKDSYAGNLEQVHAADALRDAIEFHAKSLSHIGEELPAHWVKVRTEIEARAREVPHITRDEYFAIYGRHMVFDTARALHLSRYLHDLGVFLHFQDDPLLRRTVILQNQWVTDAVYRVLDDEVVKARRGRFQSIDCERILSEGEYADKHLELINLMEHFELCYPLADSRPPRWLAPQLLPPTKPDELAKTEQADDLVLRYQYDFLPKGLISRLMVRLHRFVRDPEMAWVTGVLFQREASSVLVERLPSGRAVELRARGPENSALLSVVAAELDALNDSFPGLREEIDQLIPCQCSRCRAETAPHFFERKRLVQRKRDGRNKMECPNSYEEVSVLELLDGIRMESLPEWAMTLATGVMAHRTVRIFLASSSELRQDRDAFDLYFRQLNDRLRTRGVYLEIVRWETFLDAMSETRLQNQYNESIRKCDLFVSLFFTKTGKFTQEEFDVANDQFRAKGKPKIFTFFKNADIKTGDLRIDDLGSLFVFKQKLKELGHFHTQYDDVEHLKRQFRDQLDLMFPELG